jgi:hypothetical protein
VSADTPNAVLAWPLDGPTYRYFTNVREARVPEATAAGSWGEHVLVVDDDYLPVIAERHTIFAADPRRAGGLPHMRAAEWDALLFVLGELAVAYPQAMTLDRTGGVLHWRNRLLGTDTTFRFGDDSSLPVSPLHFAASQAVEDLFLLDERDGELHLDAVAATFTGSWSTTFSLGMTFSELHGPVPRLHGMGLVDRTQAFLTGLAPGEIVRRTNWSMAAHGDLDASLEAAASRKHEPPSDPGDLRLRVELQHLVKLPLTDTVLFTIHTQLAPVRQLVEVPEWAAQLGSVLAELPEDMAQYKNFAGVRDDLVAWIAAHTRD